MAYVYVVSYGFSIPRVDSVEAEHQLARVNRALQEIAGTDPGQALHGFTLTPLDQPLW